jgi:hypothetical protein
MSTTSSASRQRVTTLRPVFSLNEHSLASVPPNGYASFYTHYVKVEKFDEQREEGYFPALYEKQDSHNDHH